jgi:hypothetical protein
MIVNSIAAVGTGTRLAAFESLNRLRQWPATFIEVVVELKDRRYNAPGSMAKRNREPVLNESSRILGGKQE